MSHKKKSDQLMVKIKTGTKRKMTVPALIIKNGLAVTELSNENYSVTHVPTGFRVDIFEGKTSKEAAFHYLEALAELGDWQQWPTADDIPREVRDAAFFILRFPILV